MKREESIAGFMVWDEALDDLNLTPHEFRVYAFLARRPNFSVVFDWGAVLSVCQMGAGEFIQALHSLENQSLIKVHFENGYAHHYSLTEKSQWKANAQ